MSRRFLAPLALSFGLLACNTDRSDDGVAADGVPVSLRIEKLGPDFDEETNVLTVDCDAVFTLEFGPSEDAEGLLDLWSLNPPGACTDDKRACGFIDVKIESGNTTLDHYQSILLDVSRKLDKRVEGEVKLVASLRQGNSGSVWLTPDKTPVEIEKTFTVKRLCNDGLGGAGGAGGAGGSAP